MGLNNILKERAYLIDKGITFIDSGDTEEFLSYSALYTCALRALNCLQRYNLKPKDELVFQIHDNRTFLIVFWACLLGGIIPVPLSVGNNDERRSKIFRVWKILKNPFLITSNEQLNKFRECAVPDEHVEIVRDLIKKTLLADETLNENEKGKEHTVNDEDIAFIQFSSGSTGNPKGVVLSHKNLISNIETSETRSKHTSKDTMLSWMPLTHDMGLIGFHLNPLYSGMNHILLPPDLFVRRPALWMDKASKHKATILCSPNFGFSYLMKQIRYSANHSWDLSNVRLFYNGAEPISATQCDRFTDYMKRFGLREEALYPVYGLAEATLAVSFSKIEDRVSSISINRNQLKISDSISETSDDENAVSFVRVGHEHGYCCAIRIVDNDDQKMEDGVIGHVQIKGDNVTSGYYSNPTATKSLITKDGWARTGDLGFFKTGCLYITGRFKDILFVNGQNYYPHDLEGSLENIAGIGLGKVAVVGCTSNISGEEEVLVFVRYKGKIDKFLNLYFEIKSRINQNFGFEPHQVIPVHQIPKTTSGKVQRFKLAEAYKAKVFDEVIEDLNVMLEKVHTQREKVNPYSNMEHRLKEIWVEVLNHSDFGVTDNFFELGGDSLKVGQVLSLIHERFDVELNFSIFLNIYTIRKLAEIIEAHSKNLYQKIDRVDKQTFYPLSSAQRRLYYLWEVDPTSIAYNVPLAFKLSGELDLDRFTTAFKDTIQRHEILKSYFLIHKGVPRQGFTSQITFDLKVTKVHPNRLNETLTRSVQAFCLHTAPLFRAELLEVSDRSYILFFDFHHIVFDGVSVSLFVKELLSVYKGNVLPEIEIDHKDFASWESAQMSSLKIQSQEKYWRQVFHGGIPRLNFQTDFTRPMKMDFKGAKLAFSLDSGLIDALNVLARKEKTTLFTLLFAAYTILLSKYTGQNSLVVGIPVAGRSHAQLQHLIGMFVNNLAIRCSPYPSEPFIAYLTTVKGQISDAFDHQEYPFGELVKLVEEKRDISRNSVFDTMFIYQNMELIQIGETDISLKRYYFDPGFSKFDISFEIFEKVGAFDCYIEFSTALFREETIYSMASHFKNLLRCIVSAPSTRLSELSIISKNEYLHLVDTCNNTAVEYPFETGIHRLIEHQAQQNPKSIAIIDSSAEQRGKKILTYRQLNEKANQLANYLRRLGVTENAPVAVLLDRTPEFIVSIIAILKTGCYFLPIDKKTPDERTKFILDNSQSSFLITDSIFELKIKKWKIDDKKPKWVVINIYDTPFNSESSIFDTNKSRYGLAYLIYTSGTTGNPKGVKVGHQSLVNYVISSEKNFVKGEKAAFPLYTSVSFDLTMTSIFVPLVGGNTVVTYPDDDKEFTIQRVIKDNQIQILKVTPSHLKIIKESRLFEGIANKRKLKRLIVGGEVLSTQLAKQINDLFGGEIEIYNEYGPTEATVGCMHYKYNVQKDLGASVPIGFPIANTQIYLLDGQRKPVPAGVLGEIYIAGDCLARGYLFNSELEASKFVNNPFLKGTKMYKTGDMAKRLPDDTIQFMGRSDRQIKINGHRVELEEIEKRLLTHENVVDAIVVEKKNDKAESYLCAYLDLRHKEMILSNSQNEPDVKDFLASYLPHYMIPRHFISIDKISLTRNGKLNYSLLPEPVLLDKETVVEATNDMERVMIAVWKDVLSVTQMGISDNFFDLGGDSIKAVQITSRLLDKKISVSVKDILTYQTIEQICLHAEISDELNNYDQGIIDGEIGLNPIHCWFFEKEFENPNCYNQSVLLKFKKKINKEVLLNAFDTLIRHHDGLRLNYDPFRHTLFINNDLLNSKFDVPTYDLSEYDENSIPVEIERYCYKLKNTFHIEKDLLLNSAILTYGPGKTYLFITVHHLLVDGISWRVLLEDFYKAYNAFEVGKTLDIYSKTASLIDWRKKLDTSLPEIIDGNNSSYWHDNESESFHIPQDRETARWLVADSSRLIVFLDEQQTSHLLKDACRAYKTDVPTLMNVALARTLAAWTKSLSFVIEQESHGRHLEGIDVSRTIGWFTSLYPVRLILSDMNIDKNIKEVKEQLEQVPNYGFDYGVLRYIGTKNGLRNNRKKIPEIRFNYLGVFDNELDNDLFSYDSAYTGPDSGYENKLTAKLEINCMVVSKKMRVEAIYNRFAHFEETTQIFLDSFKNNMISILDHIKEMENTGFRTLDFDIELDKEDIDTLFY